MSKYVRKDHPAQQVPVDVLEQMAVDLATTVEDIRWRIAMAYDAGFIHVASSSDHVEIELSIPAGDGDD